MITQASLGLHMVTLAHKLYKKLAPTAPFCVMEFELDETTVERFIGSGGRYDAEQRMCQKMPDLVEAYKKNHGSTPPTILIILSRWTPCEKICSSAIFNLAARYPHLEQIHVYFMETYKEGSSDKTVTAMDRMNTTHQGVGAMASKTYTKLVCEPLQSQFLMGVVPNRAQEESKKNFQQAVHKKLESYGFFD